MKSDRWLRIEFAIVLSVVVLGYLSMGQSLVRWLASLF